MQFFIGAKDKTAVARPQGIALYRALRYRHLQTEAQLQNNENLNDSFQLYKYPGKVGDPRVGYQGCIYREA